MLAFLYHMATPRSRVAGLKCSSVQSLSFGLGEIYACVHPEEAYRYQCGQGAGMRAVGGACSMMPNLPLHSYIVPSSSSGFIRGGIQGYRVDSVSGGQCRRLRVSE